MLGIGLKTSLKLCIVCFLNCTEATHVMHISIFTARRSDASAVLGVAILFVRLSDCLSVTGVLCDKSKEYIVNILTPYKTTITLVF